MKEGKDDKVFWVEMKAEFIEKPVKLVGKEKLYKIQTGDGQNFDIVATSERMAISKLNEKIHSAWKRDCNAVRIKNMMIARRRCGIK